MKNSNRKEKTSRDIQAEKSRKRIYEAAIDLIADQGFDETSISDICREANCSVGAFYHHFPSKDSILEETFRIADEDFKGWKVLDGSNSSGKDMILSYMASYAELVTNSGVEFSKRFFTWRNKTFIKKGRPMQTRLIEIIKKAVETNGLRLSLPPEEAGDWIFMCARGVVFHWCLHDGDFNLKQEMGVTMKRILKGLEVEEK